MATNPLNNQRKNHQGSDGGEPSYFISYSHRDREEVEKIRRGIQKGPQKFHVWFDESNLEPGCRIDSTIEKAIDMCSAMLFVVTKSSIESEYCRDEVALGREKKKTIIPLLLDSDVKLPFRLNGVRRIDFSANFQDGLKQLYTFLAQGRRESSLSSVATEAVEINAASPPATTGLVINAPPLMAPTHFQGRDKLCRTIEEFLSDDARVLLWISGRAGSGKTALACRVLERVRLGVWADPDRRVDIDAIAYVDQKQHTRSDWRKLFNELRRLMTTKDGGAEPQKPRQGHDQTFEVQNVLANLADRRIILLIDYLDDLIDFKTRNIRGQYFRDALEAVLTVTTHRLKVIVTSRFVPNDAQKVQEGRWLSLNLSEGLPQSEAMQLLRALDLDGTARLRDGEEKLLAEICRRTQGNPGAIEALHAVLRNDRTISLIDILRDDKGLLPRDVLHVLIGESYARLDVVSKTMMQVLSVAEPPASSVAESTVLVEAGASVFRHYHPDIDPLQVLNRLVNMQLVQKTNDGQCYLLREADRRYVASQLADGASSAMGGSVGVHLDRFTLYKQHADYVRQMVSAGAPTAEAGSLTPQLEEFQLRYKGEDYAAAVDVLKGLETPLVAQGRYQELAQCYEQLAGKLKDSKLVRHRLDTLARIYHQLGKLDRAAAYYEEGLTCVRDARDRSGECRFLANLAICKQETGDLLGTTLYCMAALELARQTGAGAWEAHIWSIMGEALASLGQISTAMQANQRALKLARDNLQREVEVVALANLGQHYESLGNGNQAEDECNRACRIAQSSGFQLGESVARRNLGTLNIGRRRYALASKELTKAMKLADVTQSAQLQQTTRIELATALLLGGELCEAEATVDEALQYDTPLSSPEAHALRGVILQRQGKTREATKSFEKALEKSVEVLQRTSLYYRALDAMGVSYSGLTLSEEAGEYLDEAIGAYETAHLITNEPGIVRGRLRLFEALAKDDSEKKLVLVRNAITPAP